MSALPDDLHRFRSAVSALRAAVANYRRGFLDGCPDADDPIAQSLSDDVVELESGARDVQAGVDRIDRFREGDDADAELSQLVKCSEWLHLLQRERLELVIRLRRYAVLRRKQSEPWTLHALDVAEKLGDAVRAASEACDACIVACSVPDGEDEPADPPPSDDDADRDAVMPAATDPALARAVESLAGAVRAVHHRLGDVASALRGTCPDPSRASVPSEVRFKR